MNQLPNELILIINSFLDSDDNLRQTAKRYRKLPLTNGWYLYNKKAVVDYPVVFINGYRYTPNINYIKCAIYKNRVSIEIEYTEPEEENILYWFEELGVATSKVKCEGFEEVTVEDSNIKTLIVKP